MMKRIQLFLIFLTFYTPLFANIADDGKIESGEYDYGFIEINNTYYL